MKKFKFLVIGILTIQLCFGQSKLSPLIEVTPDSLSEILFTGESSTQLLSILNNGNSSLNFDISIEYFTNKEYQNYALQFDGVNDYVDCGNDTSLRGGQEGITIEAWIKPYSGSLGAGQQGTIIEKRNPTEVMGDWGMYIDDNSVAWRVYSTTNNPQGLIGTIDLEVDTWHHISVSYKDSTGEKRIYVNGVLDTEHLILPGLISESISTNPLTIAKNQQGDFETFDGVIDEVRLWNHVRSQEQILQYMYWELLGNEPGLAAYWKLNEGTGDITYDGSYNSNNGTLYNDPEWLISTAPVLPSQWLYIEPYSGTINPGTSMDIDANFDASGLQGGDYFVSINISSNDPQNPEVIVPVHLSVTSAPDINVSADTLDFGSVFLGATYPLPLLISNLGFEPLQVINISCPNPEFFIDTNSFVVNQGESHEVAITFNPSNEGFNESELTITSDDPDQSSYIVTLSGEGVLPPFITVVPDSLSESLFSGKTSTQMLTINNTGNSELVWEITMENTGFNTITFTKEDYADWTDPENQDCITTNICITRADVQGIFNAHTESGYNYGSPADTEWSFGYTSELQPEDYQIWIDAIYGYPPGMVNQPMSVHLISDDIYFDILFHSWTIGGDGGGFSYTRSSILPQWLEVSQDSGILSAGSSTDIEVGFNAANLEGGTYDGYIVISSNDPLHPIVNVTTHMEVIDAPSIFTVQDTLDFGKQFIGYPDTLELIVENTGSLDLLVFNVEADPDAYSTIPSFAGIDPGETEIFTIIFLPGAEGDYPGTLTFSNNDPLWPDYIIVLDGQGIEPPIISGTPDSLSVDILSGQTIIESFTINNSGESDLIFEITPGDSDQNFALKLDGIDDWIELTDFVPSDSAITIEFWISPETTENSQCFFGKHTESGGNIILIGYWWDGLHVRLRSEAYSFDEKFTGYEHLAITFEKTFSTLITVYRNGNLIYQNEYSTDLGDIEGLPWEIGQDWDGNNLTDFFKGSIDEVRIWGISRTPAEIIATMNKELTGNEPGLTGYWQFNETSGDTVFDQTTNGHHGILHEGVERISSLVPLLPAWLSVNQGSGIIPANSFQNIEAIFNADNMNAGDYEKTIIITSNDPVTPVVNIPAQMHVTGAPSIATASNILEFGQVFINYSDSLLLEVMNEGSDELIIFNAIAEPEEFEVSPSMASIEPGQSLFFTVYFFPLITEEHTGTLTFFNNDTLQNEYAVNLSGEGLEPPVILVSPESIFQQIAPGETAFQMLNINNFGGTMLNLNATVQSNSNYTLNLDGIDDWIELADFTPSSSEMTIEFWISPETIYDSQCFLSKHTTSGNYLFQTGYWQDALRVRLRSDVNSVGEKTTGNQHLAITFFDTSTTLVTVFRNGNQIFQSEYSTEIGDLSGFPWVIGGVWDGNGINAHFMGAIDELRIWSVAKTQIEINANINKELTGNESGLMGYWNFNEISGDTVFDHSMNGYHGVLHEGVERIPSSFHLQPEWFTIIPDSGICFPNSVMEIAVLFDATNLDAGNYTTNIYVHSNDPATPEMIIPVHLEVTEITGITNPDDLNPLTVYPNPFNNELLINYYLQQSTSVTLEIYDMHGQTIQLINQQNKRKGIHKLNMDGSNLKPGVYFCVLRTIDGMQTTKMIKL